MTIQSVTTALDQPQAAKPARTGALAALSFAPYRYLWFAILGNAMTLWMEMLAYGWLVLELTDSPFMLGFIGFCRTIPTVFFSLWGGVLADRMDRKRLLVLCQTAVIITVTTVAALTTLHLIEVWHVLVASFIGGIAQSLNIPARQSLISDTVPREVLPNAIALNSAAFNVAKVFGPMVAGVVVAWVSTAGVFWLESITMVGVAITTMMIQVPARAVALARQSPLKEAIEGLTFIKNDALIRGMLLTLAVPVLFAWPHQSLLPVLARDSLQVGAEGLGVLMSAAGVGALISIISLVMLGDFKHKALVQFMALLGFGIGVGTLGVAPNLGFAMVVIGISSGSMIFWNIVNQTIVQLNLPDEVRGRVMGIYMLVNGLMPLGALGYGALAGVVGGRITFVMMGVLTISGALTVLAVNPMLRRLIREM